MDDRRQYLARQEEFVARIERLGTARGKAVLARFYGMPISRVPMDALIHFFKITNYDAGEWSERLEAQFFVVCLACKFGGSAQGGTPMEKALRQLYRHGTDNLRNDIERVLSSSLDERANVLTTLANLTKIVGKDEMRDLDLAKLLFDLERWNQSALYGTRGKWAAAILAEENLEKKEEA